MEIIRSIAVLRERLAQEASIAFVPTMGNLHDGHLHLVKIAREQASCVVVSIFVNPLQFGANEDLASYPRTPEQDCARLEAAGADIVFMPSVEEMYPVPQQIVVEPPPVAEQLCGASRPGHFRGVTTVVLKLFNMVRPHVAVFGKKDFQQLFILGEMVRQLNLPIRVVGGETVRESDGLAMSSRNGYLKPAERLEAPRGGDATSMRSKPKRRNISRNSAGSWITSRCAVRIRCWHLNPTSSPWSYWGPRVSGKPVSSTISSLRYNTPPF